ncbi:MAG: DUF6261 family protein [Tannerellaceae bacterium]|nr:DUF6261 family protein [Tannerellaceae bacterium]
MLNSIFTALQTAFAKEDNLYKQSQAAFQTPEIHTLHDARVAYFNFLWDCVNIIKYKNDPSLTNAIARLEFLHHTYVHLPGENYYDMIGTMTNFLQDCELPEYHAALQLLSDAELFNLIKIVAEAKTANDTFKTLYHERSIDKVHVAALGRLTALRLDVDDAFVTFVDAVNIAWTSNELGAKDPDIRQHLVEVKDIITAAIQEAQLTLSRRGHHKPKDDGKEDEGTQTPDTTPPTPPTGGTQTPNTDRPAAPPTEQNPTDEPHHLDPNEHPAMGE